MSWSPRQRVVAKDDNNIVGTRGALLGVLAVIVALEVAVASLALHPSMNKSARLDDVQPKRSTRHHEQQTHITRTSEILDMAEMTHSEGKYFGIYLGIYYPRSYQCNL